MPKNQQTSKSEILFELITQAKWPSCPVFTGPTFVLSNIPVLYFASAHYEKEFKKLSLQLILPVKLVINEIQSRAY